VARIDFKDPRLLTGGVIAGGLIGIAVTFTGALDSSPELDRLFAGMDTNRDGFISRQEAWADTRVEQRFSLGDRNQDGKLDRVEFNELLKPRD